MDQKYHNIGDPEDHLIEECAEVIKAICKGQRFGWLNHHPDCPKRNNIELVRAEMADVFAAWEKLDKKLKQLQKDGS